MPFASLLSWRGKRLVLLSLFLILTLLLAYFVRHDPSIQSRLPWSGSHDAPSINLIPSLDDKHPIDTLIRNANTTFNNVLQRETFDNQTAAAAYRLRRGRHPPPHFDEWFKYAKSQNAVIIEELFDQIYHDIEPFWAIPPKQIRDSVHGLNYRFSIRNGTLDKSEDKRYRVNFWHEMFRKIAPYLPDLDVAFNVMDEPRVLVPWEDVHEHVERASGHGKLDGGFLRGVHYIQKYPSLPVFVENTTLYEHDWIGMGQYWDLVRETCPPGSKARDAAAIKDFTKHPEFPEKWPAETYEGYVANWTRAKDPCTHPHLRNLHGTFIEPISLSTSKAFAPMLGGSKLPNNNDILIPAPRYWTTESKFTGKGFWSYLAEVKDWYRKQNAVIWRGVASGGRSREDTWPHYQRHRFVSMLNSSHVQGAEGAGELRHFPLPNPRRDYDISAASGSIEHSLPNWIKSFADAAFTDLECFPKTHGAHCPYTDPYYSVAENMDMYKMYAYKYLPDIDGNSFSGRYRAFLLSSSLPIKATIYSEWHDSRLWAWKHFVPMDNTFVDFYGIMSYFLGSGGGKDHGKGESGEGHDEEARKIAMAGQEWAEKVLRKEDMLVYIYRLMLEYARVSSDERAIMGFVGDLEHPEPRISLKGDDNHP